MRIKGFYWLLFLLMIGTPCFGTQPSFNCDKATTVVEKLICADEDLAQLDVELNQVYREVLEQVEEPQKLKEEQLQWLKSRNRCEDRQCVQLQYVQRLDQLRRSLTNQAKPEKGTDSNRCIEPDIDWRDYRWVLLSGQGRPVCEAMFAYLDSRPADTPPPVCPEDRLPPNTDWTRLQGRDLNEAERQILIDGLPEYLRQKPGVGGSVEWKFRNAKLLRVLQADISRDGIPENLLAYAYHDYRQNCRQSTRCAFDSDIHDPEILIGAGDSYYYELQPMNAEGTQVDWSHRPAGDPAMLMGGELVFYKGRPFWLSFPEWFQKSSGNPSRAITSPNLAMFKLNGLGHSVIGQHGGPVQPAPFEKVRHIRGDGEKGCSFGYFHREYIKQNLNRKGKEGE